MTGTYDASWDRPHRPTSNELWQESDWLTFYDPDAKIGGVYRIGRQPNRNKGQPNLFCFAQGGQRFLMKDLGGKGLDCDIAARDTWETGYQVAGHRVDSLGNGEMRYRWDYPETEADLKFHDHFYTPRGWDRSDKGAEIIAWLNPEGHLECAGRVTGWIRIGDRRHDVDCYGHRDRSWGYRENYMPKMKRTLGAWGSNGPSFSFATMVLHLKTGERLVTGFVSRDGREDDIAEVRFLPTVDSDMLSPVAGIMLLTLESGEVVRIDCDIAQSHGGYAPGSAFNSVGTFVRDGKRGFCDFSVYANPSRAEHIPLAEDVSLSTIQAGLSPTADHTLLPRQS
ncbi:hypothetical protein [Novosphingobium sp. HII-3]|uniref:DUF7065 domain-containing protein n=1 Tax=Novosphingobium sp. HII-3 TaxID=2075565 RepID=UPI000CDB3B20|nr:hypothetical protein [Novosphingobium sp. HII-3]